jgi:hypothetical protein
MHVGMGEAAGRVSTQARGESIVRGGAARRAES